MINHKIVVKKKQEISISVTDLGNLTIHQGINVVFVNKEDISDLIESLEGIEEGGK